ncbi:UNVERIFIED_CONTAM: hypothetical protein Sradi_1760600 [Sesamum radiatum]|uniref:Integrase catalytic domain-containing protein n=1 Tax=Sesamum radiatum TaxID=300843 RepID=A0AAW2TVJ3_SESRA
MLLDAHELVKRCRACQERVSHPAALLQPLESPCPFDQWGLDLVGPFPQATGQRKFLIVAWTFYEVSDNGTQFSGNKLREWCKGLAIKQFFTSVSNPQANGQTEVTNRTILQHLKTRLGSAKGAWVDELPSVLWAYRTTPRTTTGESPFNLCYGTEAVAPAEIGELSWRVKHYDSTSNAQGMRVNLDLIEEAREKAAVRLLCIKLEWPRRTTPESEPRNFQVGDLVMRKAEASGPIGKLDPKWEGPYKVMEIVNAGAYRLQHLNGKERPAHVNIVNLKKYYV